MDVSATGIHNGYDVSTGIHNGYYVGGYSEYGFSNSSGEDFTINEDDYCEMVYAERYKLKNPNIFNNSEKKISSSSSSDTDLICQNLGKKLYIFPEEVNSKYSAVISDLTERKIRKRHICESCEDYYYSTSERISYYFTTSNESTKYTNTLIITNKKSSKVLSRKDATKENNISFYSLRDDFTVSCENMYKTVPFVLPMETKKVLSGVNNSFNYFINYESSESSSSFEFKVTSIRRQTNAINQKFDAINLRIDIVFSNAFPEEIKLKLIKYFNEFFSQKDNVNVITNKNTQSTKELKLTPIEQILKLAEIRTQLKVKVTKDVKEFVLINEFLNLVERKNNSEILNLISFEFSKKINNFSFLNKIDCIFSSNLPEKIANKRIIAFNETFNKTVGEKIKCNIQIEKSSKKEKKIIKKEKLTSDLAEIRYFLKSKVEGNEYFLVEPFLNEFSDEVI